MKLMRCSNLKMMNVWFFIYILIWHLISSCAPLSKKLNDQASKVFSDLASEFTCTYDDAQSIGKRYRRQDSIGTPFCVTVDFETEKDNCVTVRDRDYDGTKNA